MPTVVLATPKVDVRTVGVDFECNTEFLGWGLVDLAPQARRREASPWRLWFGLLPRGQRHHQHQQHAQSLAFTHSLTSGRGHDRKIWRHRAASPLGKAVAVGSDACSTGRAITIVDNMWATTPPMRGSSAPRGAHHGAALHPTHMHRPQHLLQWHPLALSSGLPSTGRATWTFSLSASSRLTKVTKVTYVA
jgi:hypothetical protein